MASKSKKLWGSIAQIGLPILGGIFGGPGGAALGGAAGGALSGQKGALKQAGVGALAGYGGSKLLGGLGGSGGGGNPLTSLLSMLGGGGSGGTTNSGNSAMAGISSFLPPSPFNSGGSGGGGNPLMMPKQSSNKSGFGLGSLMSDPFKLGVGLMGASQFLRSPKVPENPQSVIDFQNAARGGNPLQNQASQALMQQLGQTQQNASQDEIDALNRQYDLAQADELKSVDSMYKSLRPGTDPLSDSAYQKDLGRVRDRYATLRADSTAQLQRQISNDFASQRGQQIAQASGLGEQQLQQLAQLSQYDLDRQLTQLGIQDRDRQVLRDYLLQFGGNLASNQLDPSKALEMQLYQKLLGGGIK